MSRPSWSRSSPDSVTADVTPLYREVWADTIRVRRRSRLIADRFWLIEDLALFGEEHDLTARWWLRPEVTRAERGVVLETPEGVRLHLLPLLGPGHADAGAPRGLPRPPRRPLLLRRLHPARPRVPLALAGLPRADSLRGGRCLLRLASRPRPRRGPRLGFRPRRPGRLDAPPPLHPNPPISWPTSPSPAAGGTVRRSLLWVAQAS